MISFDLESGYYHVVVASEDQKFLGFQLFGKRYVFCELPFGRLRYACYAFTEVCKVPVGQLRAKGIRVLPYLDDFLCALQNMPQAVADEARRVFERLGFLINFAKSVLVPTKRIENLGFVVDTYAMTYEVTSRRMQKFVTAADDLFQAGSGNGLVPARLVARVTGHIAAAALVLERRGRLHSHYLNHSIYQAGTLEFP
uniref:Reverse transcriptase domain-containing protein n=1 Tax=Aureoumbra lagunensis TaxID=44058 RepID=A0A7S3JZP5_9STRA|mmetsp:Transcript_14722/g.22183  ORF Transcript_14722/g.22183 Transcript_14722/m.22183 type:complete len:198 (-) Transcript_14722:141-734(-)